MAAKARGSKTRRVISDKGSRQVEFLVESRRLGAQGQPSGDRHASVVTRRAVSRAEY
jgi:hypothetical protein